MSDDVRFAPYISSDVKASVEVLLLDKAITQAETLVRVIDTRRHQDFPDVLLGLDRETRGLASARVANMLRAYAHILSQGPDDPWMDPDVAANPDLGCIRNTLRSILFEPIEGEKHLTAPGLLVIQAALYSHAAWFRESLHEYYSAQFAYHGLSALDEAHRRFVTALVAHQTLLRTSWGQQPDNKDKEVAALQRKDGKLQLDWDCSAVMKGIARTLLPFAEDLRPQLAAALVLHAFCLQCRHARTLDPKLRAPGVLKQVRDDLKELLRLATDSPETTNADPRLVFWQFGKTVRQSVTEEKWQCFSDGLLARAEGVTDNVTVCFPSVASVPVHVWEHALPATPATLATPSPVAPEMGDGIGTLLANTVGVTFRGLGPSPPETLLCSLGIADAGLGGEVKTWISNGGGTLKLFGTLCGMLQRRSTEHPVLLPVPLVAHVLRQMQRQRSGEFTVLRIEAHGIPAPPDLVPLVHEPLTVYLPRLSEEDPGAKEMSLIGRYVAAVVNNLAVLAAPSEIVLDYYGAASREQWAPKIREELAKNGWQTIQHYLGEYRATLMRDHHLSGRAERPWSFDPWRPVTNAKCCGEESVVLGIDVGGTAIKWQLFSADAVEKDDATPVANGSFATDALHGLVVYKDIDSFARHVLTNIRTHVEEKEGTVDGVVAIGIAWPGPVEANRWVAATSGILGKLREFSGFLGHNSAVKVHSLDLVDACVTAAWGDAKGKPIFGTKKGLAIALNDGEADIMGDSRTGGDSGVVAVIKIGTGTAFSLEVGGRPVPILGELGKAVLDVKAEPTGAFPPGAFPLGVVRDYLSGGSLRYKDKNDQPVDVPDEECGRRLADVVALVVDLFHCDRVRVGGGPLAYTGLGNERNIATVIGAAKKVLESAYGFKVKDEPSSKATATGSPGRMVLESRQVHLVYPERGTNAGPLGAARAAFRLWVASERQKGLVKVRDDVAMMSRSLTVEEIMKEAAIRDGDRGSVTQMLQREALTLGLIREMDANGRETWRRSSGPEDRGGPAPEGP